MLKTFITKKVLAAIIGSLMTTLGALLAAKGVSVGADTLNLWQEALVSVLGVGLSIYGGTDTPQKQTSSTGSGGA